MALHLIVNVCEYNAVKVYKCLFLRSPAPTLVQRECSKAGQCFPQEALGTDSRGVDWGSAAMLRGRGESTETKVSRSVIQFSSCCPCWGLRCHHWCSSNLQCSQFTSLPPVSQSTRRFLQFVGDGGSAAKKQTFKKICSCWQQLCYHSFAERKKILLWKRMKRQIWRHLKLLKSIWPLTWIACFSSLLCPGKCQCCLQFLLTYYIKKKKNVIK